MYLSLGFYTVLSSGLSLEIVTFRWPGADTWPVSPWRPVTFPVAWRVKVDTQLPSPRRPYHLPAGVFY